MPLILGKYSLREWVRPDGDPGRIAKKALTNMAMEKAIDYPEPKPCDTGLFRQTEAAQMSRLYHYSVFIAAAAGQTGEAAARRHDITLSVIYACFMIHPP